jgi:hypothetical protein
MFATEEIAFHSSISAPVATHTPYVIKMISFPASPAVVELEDTVNLMLVAKEDVEVRPQIRSVPTRSSVRQTENVPEVTAYNLAVLRRLVIISRKLPSVPMIR